LKGKKMYRSSSVQCRSLAELTGGFNETERNFFQEARKMLSRNFRDFTGAALALSRISLMPAKYNGLIYNIHIGDIR
jgi:hypothetical protein